ncbi:MAG: acyltransferase, partial [Ilumatobacteraceae bacterium]|nr:acyltransferase [Ilumatobacteraceae bacterium]
VQALDGLRGIAVLLVVMSHLPNVAPGIFDEQKWLRGIIHGGYLGVDIFFVLSGFLITSLLAEAFESTDGRVRVWRNFYGRRALRLLPALVVLMVVFTAVTVADGATLGSLWPSVRSVLLYYNNWHSVWDPEHFNSDLGHLWSLAIEEQFYIVWPVVLAAVLAFSRRLWVRLALVAVPVVWVFWYRARLWDTGAGWVNVFVRTDTRIDTLLIGCLLALVFRYARPRREIVAWVGAAGSVALLVMVAKSTALQAWMYKGGFLITAVAAGAVVLAIAEGAGPYSKVMSNEVLRLVGRVSYGLYLWHLPVFNYVFRHTPTWSAVPRALVAVGASFALTAASWVLIERVALSRKDKWFGSRAAHSLPVVRANPPVFTQYVWRGVIAVGAGSVVTLALANVWPHSEIPMTDRMGYALIEDFHLNRYWQVARLWMLLMPLIAVFVWSLLPRLAHSRPVLRSLVGDAALPRVDFDDTVVTAVSRGGAADSVARLGVVGATAGLLVAVSFGPGMTNGWWWLVLTAAAYVGVVVLVARRGPVDGWRDRAAVLNLLASSSLPLVLWWAARTTYVTRVDNGKRVEYHWIPLLPMLVVAVVLLLVDAVWLRRNGIAQAFRRERSRLVFFVVPVLLFTWVSRLRGSTERIDVFHHGESLNGGWLWATGRVPWRDFFFNVGFYPAVFAPRAAFRLFGTSIWGLTAGTYMFLIPILVVTIYVACAVLVTRYWVALAAIVVLLAFPAEAMGGFLRILDGDATLFIFRFSFMAPAMVALLFFLRKSTWFRAIVFGALVVLNVIMSSETIVFATAFCVTIFVRDVVGWRRGRPAAAHFAATIKGAVGMLVGIGLAAAVLWQMGALGAYVGWWRIFPFRWYIETGNPIGLGTNIDSFRWGSEWVVFFAIPISVLCCIAFAVWRLRTRREIRTEDWVALALALGNLFFYQKALNRPDSHVYQSLITSIPLWFYMVVRGITTVAETVKQRQRANVPRERRSNTWLAIAAVVALFPFMPVASVLNAELADAGSRWKVTSAPPAPIDRIGYMDDAAFVQTAVSVRDFVDANLGRDALIFDFANASGLYNFVLNERPLTRFSYALQMSTRPAMREVIATLRQRSPEVVVYAWDGSIDEWDYIPNSIRHFDLGEYILRNYTPWAVVGDKGYKQTLMLRNDLRPGYLMPDNAVPAVAGQERVDELFALQDCNWGHAVNHLKVVPEGGERVKADPVLATITAFGWAHTTTDDPVPISVMVRGTEVFRGLTTPNRADLAARNVQTGKNSGFYFDIPVIEAVAAPEEITVARVAEDGSLVELPRVAKQGVNDATGEFDVRLNQAIDGQVPIGGGTESRFLMRIEFPKNRTDFSWLVVRSKFGFADTNFALYDKALDPTRQAKFSAAARTHATGGLVAACPEWYAWDTNVLYLEYDHVVLDPEVFISAESENR